MKIYSLRKTQFLPITQDMAWTFFSSPGNLGKITPEGMGFRILRMSGGDKMYQGQIIQYKIKVFPHINVNWVTEITHVEMPGYFVDEQRFGPYSWWHHQHFFQEVKGGVEMTDEVNYAMPLGILGRLAHLLFVRRQIMLIFDYRSTVLKEYFSLARNSSKSP